MWNIIRADEFCESVRDGTHDTPKPVENGFKLVTSKHILNGRVYPEDAYCISEKDFKKINERSKVDKWDVLMSMIGNGLGKSAIIDYTPDFAIKNIALFKIGNEAKAKWLHYFLSSNYAQNVILNYLQGTGQPFLSLNLIRGFKIWNPPNTILEKIVKILSRYDEAIENNNKRIKLLEQMAQNLYKEWFVRFRFPGYENCEFENGIPKGWKVEKLGNVANISTGKCNREDAEDDGIYPLFDRSQEIKLSNDWIKDCEAIIVPGEGTSFIPRYFVGKFNLHQRCYCVEPKIDKTGKFLFYTLMLNRRYFLSVATGATVPSLRYNNFAKMKFVMPELGVCQKFDDYITKYFLQIDNLKIANKNLAKQRDLLLPRLMSGKIEVEE
ncbi:MAG: restriction endonuclease subunit S [Treponema sp.]|nr:restriction endonuclease subunit S [Treponema sp.]